MDWGIKSCLPFAARRREDLHPRAWPLNPVCPSLHGGEDLRPRASTPPFLPHARAVLEAFPRAGSRKHPRPGELPTHACSLANPSYRLGPGLQPPPEGDEWPLPGIPCQPWRQQRQCSCSTGFAPVWLHVAKKILTHLTLAVPLPQEAVLLYNHDENINFSLFPLQMGQQWPREEGTAQGAQQDGQRWDPTLTAGSTQAPSAFTCTAAWLPPGPSKCPTSPRFAQCGGRDAEQFVMC